jgi:hypothetical protein
VLIVDKVDSTSTTLLGRFKELLELIEVEKAQADGKWQEAQIGVFVLHNKQRGKTVDLRELMPGRWVPKPAELLCCRYPAADQPTN